MTSPAKKAAIVKQGENFIIYDDGTIRLDKVRFSYLFCFDSRAPKKEAGSPKLKADGSPMDGKFEVTALLKRATHAKAIIAVRDFCQDLAKKKFQYPLPATQICIRDGNLSNVTKNPQNKDNWCLKASDSDKPTTLGLGNKVITKAENKENPQLYSGAIGSVLIRPWVQEKKKFADGTSQPERINANLLQLRFTEHATALSTRGMQRDVDDVWGDMNDGESALGDADGLGSDGLDDFDGL